MTAASLTESQRRLLKWLSEEDYSQYGECHGSDLDALVAAGLAQVHGPGEHQRFIANGPGLMYRAVSLTEAGIKASKQ